MCLFGNGGENGCSEIIWIIVIILLFCCCCGGGERSGCGNSGCC